MVFHYVDVSVKAQHAGASDEAIKRVEEATRHPSLLYYKAMTEIEQAKRQFLLYLDVYGGSSPWYPLDAVKEIDEGYFNKYWLQGEF
jgi:hypothetical protein